MKKFTFLIGTLMLGLFLSNCTKEGPAGPAGAQGNANVTPSIYSVTSWSNNGTSYYENLSVSALNSTIQNGGGVEVFISVDAGTNWTALPFTQYGSSDYIATYTTSLYNVEVDWTNNGVGLGSDPNSYYGISATDFKVVCIAPAIIKQHPNVNWKDYNQVKAFIKD